MVNTLSAHFCFLWKHRKFNIQTCWCDTESYEGKRDRMRWQGVPSSTKFALSNRIRTRRCPSRIKHRFVNIANTDYINIYGSCTPNAARRSEFEVMWCCSMPTIVTAVPALLPRWTHSLCQQVYILPSPISNHTPGSFLTHGRNQIPYIDLYQLMLFRLICE